MKEKILIVEDDFISLEGLKLNLEPEGYELITASGGREAIRLIEREKIDLVLSDIIMDDFNGIDLLRYVKMNHPDVVIILITGYGSLDIVIQALREGAYDYLLKPCSDEELRMRVKRGLEQQRVKQLLSEKSRQDGLLEFVTGFSKKLNDLVAGISGNYEVLRSYIDFRKHPDAQKSLRSAELFINRSARIVNDLCQATQLFTAPDIKPFHLREAFFDVIAKFGSERIELHLPPRLPAVIGGAELSSAFVHVVQNSIDACASVRKIKISANLDEKGEFIEVIFEDRGVGVLPHDLSKVYLPFFTTKSKSHAGLGLWIAYQTVKYYQGTIRIQSEIDVGTVVTIRLPLFRAKESLPQIAVNQSHQSVI